MIVWYWPWWCLISDWKESKWYHPSLKDRCAHRKKKRLREQVWELICHAASGNDSCFLGLQDFLSFCQADHVPNVGYFSQILSGSFAYYFPYLLPNQLKVCYFKHWWNALWLLLRHAKLEWRNTIHMRMCADSDQES